MDGKKIDERLLTVMREWEYLTVEQKRKILWIVRKEQIKWWLKRIIPIAFLITLVQFIIWLAIK